MGLGEFALIDRYFRKCGVKRADVRLGVGDDAALLDSPAGCELVAAIDTLVAGVHFPHGSPAASIGHRALAVNLSDLAAMGARPAWALLALTVPNSHDAWLSEFAAGFSALAYAYDVALVGGDTTSGPLCVSVQILGHVPKGAGMLRSGARPGDLVFVSGTPGDAAAGLAVEQGRLDAPAAAATYLRKRFLFPSPRMALGERLRSYASACIDVSDGLLGDVGKLAHASGCGVELSYGKVPVSEALVQAVGDERARELALTGGDDYELCFTVKPEHVGKLRQDLPPQRWGYSLIGVVQDAPGAVVMSGGNVMEFSHSGYDHFGSSMG
ncbi:MAG: Thiamine-monophosphate kinase [Gammaproteobacteria bacterium]|jgi:thiamine-monophosphate kinase|nr:Thiamine-monophosphate kinase [Gammaproteobacteria bacterium]